MTMNIFIAVCIYLCRVTVTQRYLSFETCWKSEIHIVEKRKITCL